MIKDLPSEISADLVSQFDIGQPEALEDDLLWDCYCDIFSIKEYLKNKKDVLLGNKGSGKTAVFRLLKEKKIHFYNQKNLKQIIVPIDETVEYLSISSKLKGTMKTSIESEDTQYRFLWEAYILYRMAIVLQKEQPISDNVLANRLKLLTDFFGATSSRPTLLEFLSSTKKTAGFKLDYTNPAMPMPDFYISAEPSRESDSDNNVLDPRVINIDETKNLLNQCLRRNKSAIYVLVDNVDDFIAREGYEVQKKILQGLLACSRSYTRHSLIKVKLFLRGDLFHKLNFSELGGYDKVAPRTLPLTWSDSDIRRFIAERILKNLANAIGIRGSFRFEINQDSLVLRRKSYAQKNWLEKAFHHLGFENFQLFKKKDERDAWHVTEMDRIWRDAITSVLPRTVNYHDMSGALVEGKNIFSFFEDHFALSSGSTTPRVMLLFLEKLISLSGAYYRDMPGEMIHLDKNGEYPLFKRDHILTAYSELQETMIKMFISCVTKENWRKGLHTFFSKRGKRATFSYKTLSNAVEISDQAEFRDFVAFLEHLGVLKCSNKTVSLSQRRYDLPILLQKNWVAQSD